MGYLSEGIKVGFHQGYGFASADVSRRGNMQSNSVGLSNQNWLRGKVRA